MKHIDKENAEEIKNIARSVRDCLRKEGYLAVIDNDSAVWCDGFILIRANNEYQLEISAKIKKSKLQFYLYAYSKWTDDSVPQTIRKGFNRNQSMVKLESGNKKKKNKGSEGVYGVIAYLTPRKDINVSVLDVAAHNEICLCFSSIVEELKRLGIALDVASPLRRRRSHDEEEQTVTTGEIEKFAEECKEVEEKLGKRFSIFDILKISRMEIRHSNMLAWLLDSNENHGFGVRVLQEVLEAVNAKKYAPDELRTFSVYREQDNIDILLVSDALNEIIAIENKIGAKEGIRKTKKTDDVESQLTTYENVLANNFARYSKVLLFLTPEGDPPTNGHWTPVSYRTLIAIVEGLYKKIYSNDRSNKAVLIQDYINTIKKEVLMEVENDVIEICRRVYNENKAAVKAVLKYGATNVGEVVEKKLKSQAANKAIGLTHVGRSRFRLASLDAILKSGKKEKCWWGEGAYCCWVDVDVDKSKVSCTVGVVNSDDKALEAAIRPWKPSNKKNRDTEWTALRWYGKRKYWEYFDETSTESIEDAVGTVIQELINKASELKRL